MQQKEDTFRVILSFLLLIIPILFIVERKTTEKTIAVSAMSQGTIQTLDKSRVSKAVVLKIMEEIALPNGREEGNITYNSYLKNYLKQQQIQLSSETSLSVAKKLAQLLMLMEIEDKSDLPAMSLDSREMAIRLIKDIYKSCGLKLYADYSGKILKITDTDGNLLYEEETIAKQESFRLNILIIIITPLLLLFALCLFLAKKHQLYKKDVTFDVQKKEGYA